MRCTYHEALHLGRTPTSQEVIVEKSIDPRQQALLESWDARGRPDCTHEKYERHRMPPLGWDTGDYLCTSCGTEWDRGDPWPGPQDAANYL